jgi:TonB family protein
MEGFEQIEIRNGEMLYTKRNIDYTPVRIKELLDLLQFAQPEELIAKKQKQRVENGTAVSCIQAETKGPARKLHELCIDSSSHDILSDSWQVPPDEQRKQQFSDFVEFAGSRYPRNLELRLNGSTAITAHLQSLTSAAFDEALLVVPQGAIERRQCINLKPPVALSTPDPDFGGVTSGVVTVAMTVFANGSVGDMHILGTSNQAMNERVLETLKTWRFKPAMCGQDPVDLEIEVIVSSRL